MEERSKAENILPAAVDWSRYADRDPVLAEPIIEGVLRKGHKMLLQGASKAGKSFCLVELALALTNGRRWLGKQCARGKTLYLNLEIDGPSFVQRVLTVAEAMGIDRECPENFPTVFNLRSVKVPTADLVQAVIQRINSEKGYVACIFDPIYKLGSFDECDAQQVADFCQYFDEIAEKTGCAVIYCHHHSKSGGAGYQQMNRGSGSGVFSRDPDTIVDLAELDTSKIERPQGFESAIPFRVSFTLREFRPLPDLEIWYRYPLHIKDELGILARCDETRGAVRKGAAQGTFKDAKQEEQAKRAASVESLLHSYESNADGPGVPLRTVAADWGTSERTVRDWLKNYPKYGNRYQITNGKLYRNKATI